MKVSDLLFAVFILCIAVYAVYDTYSVQGTSIMRAKQYREYIDSLKQEFRKMNYNGKNT